MHYTANIKIHSLEMMIGKSRKPQNIFIIVHGSMPRYFKPSNGPHRLIRSNPVEMMNWVQGFQKVANAIARRASLTPSPRSSSEDDTKVTSRSNKPRPDQDSGIDITPITPRASDMSTDQPEKGAENSTPEEDTPVNILPEAIEMDIPEEDSDDDVGATATGGGGGGGGDVDDHDGPCRRSRMVLTNDRYEEQFVSSKSSIISKSTFKNSKSLFEPIQEKGPKPEPKPRTLKTVEEIRNNIVTMRLSTWPNRPESGEGDQAKDPDYQKVVVKTQRQLSEPEVVDIEPDGSPNTRPKRNPSVAKWKTMDLAKNLEKVLGDKLPIGTHSRRSVQERRMKQSRPITEKRLSNEDDEDEGGDEASYEDPENEPPYDRLSKFRRDKNLTDGAGIDQDDDEKVNEEDKRSSGESLPDIDRKRLYTDPSQIRRRPLPHPNQETDWKDVGNMVYEQSCRSCKVSVPKSDVKNALVLVKVQDELMIAGWKNDVSHKLHGKFHVGDVILQVNEIMVDENGPEFVLALINSSAKNEIPFVIKRLPYASIKELNKTAEQTSWGLETHKNEIKGVSGPALDGGITPKTSAVLSSKQCEWVVTELAHQRIPSVKCSQDEVKQRLEDLSSETNLVLIIQPRDLISELREGLKRTKHSSEYYV
ncbi:nucleolar protein dao-5 isoform X2 [Strongylocentrotus purpuratus]|uniref:Uncharacterized protein n=1 Tax=Strongylocentrotus purpuratus TaxID=7668 RepID=A0A7M7HFY3_STRPU|nr:nucleolar protein dao-5 isoform X2 [Strongylocentrotus purpuratus]